MFNLYLLARGYTEGQLGVLTGALTAGTLVGAIPAAWLIHRFGLKRALLFCFAFAPSMLCVRAMAPQFPVEVALSLFGGAGLSLWAVCLSPAVAAMRKQGDRPLAFSLLFSFGIGAGAAGAFAGSRVPGWVAAHLAHTGMSTAYQITLVGSCCLAIVGLWPASRLRFQQHSPESGGNDPWRPRLLLGGPLMRLLPAIGVWGLVTGSFAPFANIYLSSHLHLPLSRTGNFFSASQLAQVIAVLLAPAVFRRIGVVPGICLSQLGTSLLFILLAVTDRTPAAGFVYVGLTALQWMNEPGLYTLLMGLVSERERAGASASMSLVLSCSQLLAALAAGWAFERFSYVPVFTVIAVLGVLAATLVRAIPRGNLRSAERLVAERRGEPILSDG